MSETIKIQNQVWAITNLDVSFFQNGDPIMEAKTPEEWKEANGKRIPAWCILDNNPENAVKFGKLYNFYAVSDERGLAPDGYVIPNLKDWKKLIKFSEGAEIAGKKLKSINHWNVGGENAVGFNALPANFRYPWGDFGTKLGAETCSFWCSDVIDETHARGITLGNKDEIDLRDFGSSYLKGQGRSIRLIKL
jgi:uncharacterized protein (TIGR02145 family)